MSDDAPWALSHLIENGNVRNVKRLYELLEDSQFLIDDRECKSHFPEFALACWLASRGVLVPSALTNDDAMEVGRAEARAGFIAKNVAAVLERIAKGEAE